MITSADVPPRTLAAWVQGHWIVENALHYVVASGFRCKTSC